MSRLRCRSENHRHDTPPATVTRCPRCEKPTCGACEGRADDFREALCDGCWVEVDEAIGRLRDAGQFRRARGMVRRWASRSRLLRRPGSSTPYRRLLADYDLDTPETGYRSAA